MWIGSELNPLCASANEESGPLVNNAPLTKPANERVRKGNEQASSSVPKLKAQTDVTSSTSLEGSLEPKFLARGEQHVKDRRVLFGILPCVMITCLKADASMAIIACFDMRMVRRSPARGRRVRVLKEQLRF